jgi:hypothetical protein
MRISSMACVAVGLGIMFLVATSRAESQTITPGAPTIALKNGESTELGSLYWISHCRSLLKEMPEVELLEGPSTLSVSVKKDMVLARRQGCPNKVPGAKLVVSAKDVEDPSLSTITIRVTFRTKDGDRQLSQIYNLSLLP